MLLPVEHPADPTPLVAAPRLAIVLWNGNVGGAESVKAMIAREWRRAGIEASVVFVTDGGGLGERLVQDGIRHAAVGLPRGRGVLTHPRRLARVVMDVGPDGALLVDTGYLSAALRLGGYTGPIVGVEHGKLLVTRNHTGVRRLRDVVERTVGARYREVDVGVSDFMLDEIRRHPHARRVCRIYNGVDTESFSPAVHEDTTHGRALRVGAAARLVPGKGLGTLIHAVAELRDIPLHVEIAGDGPERPMLEQLVNDLRLRETVFLRGSIRSMPEFWRSCDLAVVPSDAFVESFSMTTLEAMASGVPVVAARNGGITEVVADGETGTVVPPGDTTALSLAIRAYATDSELRRRHALAARERVVAQFRIEATAQEYLALLTGLARS